MKPDEFIKELWSYAAEVPMEQHPWFDGIIKHRWTREQIIQGEVQHYLRVRTNPIFFGYMAVNAVAAKDYALMETILENFMEELGGQRTHMDIMLQFLEEGGITKQEADNAEPAPGTLIREAPAPKPEGPPQDMQNQRPFLDLVCFNVYLDSDEPLQAYLARLHNIAGDRPLLITELGLDSRSHGADVQARAVYESWHERVQRDTATAARPWHAA